MTIRTFGCWVAVLATGLAVQATSLKQDTQEFRVEGQFDPSSNAGTVFEAGLSYGYFVADNIEVGGRISYYNDDYTKLFSFGPFVEYNFETGNELVPFVGASLEYVNGEVGDDNNDALALSGYGGAKFFLSENVAIFARLVLSGATDDVYANDAKVESTEIHFDFGMSYYLP